MGSVVIGSRAMDRMFPGELGRKPKDTDFIVSFNEEVLVPPGSDVFSHPSLDEWVGRRDRWSSIDELYTIKLSHSYWELKNGSWNKHIFDLRWLKRRGAKLLPSLHDTLYLVWEELHGAKRTNLSMDKDSFFKDAVVRIYDHDSIHDSVAYGTEALYNSILRDGSTVDVDPKKMWSLSHSDLVLLFREEICATALERILIPSGYKASPGYAYRWALRRTITSLTKGKSARFILENFVEFALPDNYLKRHLLKQNRLVRL
jgi:hypothetical protein